MVDRFHCLRHHTVISGNYQDRNICSIGTAHTHGSKRLMARCVKEGDLLIIDGNHVGTDVLCDTACLSVCHMGVSDTVQKRCFTMVNVAHNADYRRSRNQ